MFSNKPNQLGMFFQNMSGLYAAGKTPQSPNVMIIGGRIKSTPFLTNIRFGFWKLIVLLFEFILSLFVLNDFGVDTILTPIYD